MDNEKQKFGQQLPIILSVLALLLAAFAIIGPMQSQPAAAQPAKADSFDRIVAEGKITACYIPWPPSVIKDPNTGKLSGFLIDVFDKMAEDANLKVTYMESTWGGFPADLKAGKCDVGVAGIYPLIGRSTSVSFTRPYLYSGYSAAVLAGDGRFAKVDDFNKEDVRIAVIQGEFGHIYAQKYLPKAKLIVLEKGADFTMPIVAVSSGQADAGFTQSDVLGEYAKIHPEVRDLYPNAPFATDPTTFAVRQEDQKLLNFLDNGLSYLGSKGFIKSSAKAYNATYWYEAHTEYRDISKE